MLNISQWFTATNAPPPTDAATTKAAADAAAAKNVQRRDRLAKLRTEEPNDVRITRQILERHGMQKAVHRAVYCAQIALTSDQMSSGNLPLQIEIECAPQSNNNAQPLQVRVKPGERAYLLSAEVVESDSTAMPFTTTWTLAQEPLGGRAYVCGPRRKWAASQQRGGPGRQIASVPLLSRPVGVEEPTLDLQFSSLQAVGFNSAALMTGLARRLRSNHYKIPKAYPYAGLIRDVHAALTLAEQRARWEPLAVETAPLSSYTLQSSPTHMLIGAPELERVTKYINERLVTANEPFDVDRLVVRVEPFGGETWLDAWQDALRVGENSRSVAVSSTTSSSQSTQMTIGVAFVVYYCTLPDRELAMPSPAPSSAASSVCAGDVRMMAGMAWEDIASQSADNSDDDDMTLVDTMTLQTPIQTVVATNSEVKK